MKFKHDGLAAEYKEIDEGLRNVLDGLDGWSRENKIVEPVATQIFRSKDEQEDIYSRHGLVLIHKLRDGVYLDDKDRALALELNKLSLPELRDWARRRFSWHMVGCAVDLRIRHYSMSEFRHVMEFLGKRCTGPEWELLSHDVTAPHIHVGRRDKSKREILH